MSQKYPARAAARGSAWRVGQGDISLGPVPLVQFVPGRGYFLASPAEVALTCRAAFGSRADAKAIRADLDQARRLMAANHWVPERGAELARKHCARHLPQPTAKSRTALRLSQAARLIQAGAPDTALTRQAAAWDRQDRLAAENRNTCQEPRDDHGCWTTGGPTKDADKTLKFDKDKAADYARTHALKAPDGNCGKHVTDYVRQGGIQIKNQGSAGDLGKSLLEAGFVEVPEGEPLEKGDIIVFPKNYAPDHKNGHAQMYDGKDWYAGNYQDRGLYPNRAAQNLKSKYKRYRHV